jgi:flagellar hook-basal body complex protein FliE
MRIDGIGSQLSPSPIVEKQAAKVGESSFGDSMRDAVSKVSDLESNADQFANKLAAGDAVEIHQAMIAMQKASTALQFTIQVRNKIIEAYHEIMRMQV